MKLLENYSETAGIYASLHHSFLHPCQSRYILQVPLDFSFKGGLSLLSIILMRNPVSLRKMKDNKRAYHIHKDTSTKEATKKSIMGWSNSKQERWTNKVGSSRLFGESS